MSVVSKNYQALLVPAKKYLTLDDVTYNEHVAQKEWAGYRSAGKEKTFNLADFNILNEKLYRIKQTFL